MTAQRRRYTWDERGRLVTSDSAYATRLADLQVATKTIGDTNTARLSWVVRFAAEDPATWHSAMRTAHGDCLVALANHGLYTDALCGGLKLPPPLTPEQIVALQGDLRTILRTAVGAEPGAPVPIPTEGLTESLVRLTLVGVKPAMWGMSYGFENPRTAVLQAVKTLILQHGERLVACPACGAPLLSVRKQRFCSIACAQRFRNERNAPKRARKTDRRKGVRRAR